MVGRSQQGVGFGESAGPVRGPQECFIKNSVSFRIHLASLRREFCSPRPSVYTKISVKTA